MKKNSVRKYVILTSIILLTALLFVSCKKNYKEESFFCMDTFVSIKVSSDDENALKECRELLIELDSELSRHNEESSVYQFNQSTDGVEISERIKELIVLAEGISGDTDGAFTVFSGSLTSLWSNSVKYPTNEEIEKAAKLAEEKAFFEGSYLKKTQSGVMLEFGGIAKGYACDKAIELLKNNGVESAMISFSSSIGVFGTNPEGKAWKIAIKDPQNTSSVLGYVLLESGGLSVSGDYERSYEIEGKKYNHIIDAKSGLPVDNGVHSVVVVSDSCAESDALSTAFFVMGVDKVNQKYSDSKSIKYLFVTDDGIFMNDSMKEVFVQE